MKLCFVCNSCFSENILGVRAKDRAELQSKYSDSIVNSICSKCGVLNKTHLNKIYAEVSSVKLLLLFIISIIIATWLVIEYYNSFVRDRSFNIGSRGLGAVVFVGIAPVFIWSVVYQADFEKAKLFNSYKI